MKKSTFGRSIKFQRLTRLAKKKNTGTVNKAYRG
jgi:hypothetical protein